MPNILDTVLKELPGGVIESANFEGANIVVYTKDKDFFLKGEPKIRGVVDKIKKRIELRAAEDLLLSKDDTEKFIKKTIPKEADIQSILFDEKRSIVVIEVKRPGVAIGRKGEILKSIKEKTFWVPEAIRSPAIKSKITDAIRHVLFVKGEYRKRFLNSLGKKIYKEWSPEKREEWIRIGFLGGARQVGRSCFLLQTPESKILLDCGINIASETEKFPYLNVPEFDLKAIDAVIITHAHLDHSGLLPYLYRLGYRGPCYMTAPTRDIAALLALDYIGVAYKKALKPLYRIADIQQMVKHSIALNYNEVTDITPDVRLTLYNAGHTLGSVMAHLNIGNGLHNLLYSLDYSNLVPVIDNKNNVNFNQIGEFIDKLFKKHNNQVINDGFAEKLINKWNFKTISFNPKTYKSEIKKISSFIRHKINEDLYEIKTTSGRRVIVTGSHSLFSVFNGSIKEINANLLKQGDFIIAPKKIPAINKTPIIDLSGYSDLRLLIEDNKKIDHILNNYESKIKLLSKKDGILAKKILFDYFKCAMYKKDIAKKYKIHTRRVRRIFNALKIKGHPRVKDAFKSKLIISKDFARFLGYYIAEGHCRKNSQTVQITNYDDMILKDCCKIIRDTFGIKGDIRNNAILFHSKQLKLLLNKVLKCGDSAYRKRIPKEILFSNKELIAHLLYGYFSGDGGISNKQRSRHLTANSKSKGLIDDIIFMFLQFGLIPTLKFNKTTKMYIATIYDKNSIKKFLKEIGINNKRTGSLTKSINSINTRSSFAFRIPKTALSGELQGYVNRSPWQNATTCGIWNSNNFEIIEMDQKIINSDLMFDKISSVKKVKPTSNFVYDFSIDKYENFLGGEGFLFLHNTSDFKFAKTNVLESAISKFPRLETLMIESTYGGKQNVLPSRKECENILIEAVNKAIARKGKVLIPVLGVGRAQEVMMIVDKAAREKKLPDVPIYVDGMVWDVTAIHTAYPEFMAGSLRDAIFQDKNPFASNLFKRVGSPTERKEILEGGPCIILATSGMLVGGASVEYFRNLADNKRNALIFVCYQGPGSLGRQVQEGAKEVRVEGEKEETVSVNLEITSIDGLSVSADTPVFIENDNSLMIKNIGEIVDKYVKKEGVAQIKNMKTAAFDKEGKLSLQSVRYVIKHKTKGNWLKVKTKSGKEVKVSKSHSLFILKDGKINPIKCKELKRGDHIIIPKKLPEPNSIKSVDFLEFGSGYTVIGKGQESFLKPKRGGSGTNYIKRNCNNINGLAKFLGYYIAEGHLDMGGGYRAVLSFGSHEKEIIRDFIKIVKKSFFIEPKLRLNPHCPSEINVAVQNKVFVKFLKSLKIGSRAKNKRVPSIVFNMPREARIAFLKAYFAGDGYLYNKRYLCVKSASKQLISDIAYLLLQLGIIARIKGPHKIKARKKWSIKESQAYKLYIYEKEFKQIDHLIGHVPFALPIKEICLDKIWKFIKDFKIRKRANDYVIRCRKNLRKYIGLNLIKKILQNLDKKINQHKELTDIVKTLRALVFNDIAIDCIADIQEIKAEKYEYDLSVDKYENFCGGFGGVMLHNTGHAGRNELLSFVNSLSPMPRRIIVQHGEVSRSLDLASTLYKLHRIETNVPRNLETMRLH